MAIIVVDIPPFCYYLIDIPPLLTTTITSFTVCAKASEVRFRGRWPPKSPRNRHHGLSLMRLCFQKIFKSWSPLRLRACENHLYPVETMVDKKKKRNKAHQPKTITQMTANEDRISGTMAPSLKGEDLINVSSSRVCSSLPPEWYRTTPCFWKLMHVYEIASPSTWYGFSIHKFIRTFPEPEAYWKRAMKYDGEN